MRDARVRVCPEGPILVRGAAKVVDEHGAEHVPLRPVVAICGCGKSSRKPWCDSTHKSVPGTSPVGTP
jgi:CDGSH-type Zn-finger protein